jgi:hypothetical protein
VAKDSRMPKRVKKTTKGVGVRLKKSTIEWVGTQLDEDTPTVPAKVRKWVEDKEAEAKKNAGG